MIAELVTKSGSDGRTRHKTGGATAQLVTKGVRHPNSSQNYSSQNSLRDSPKLLRKNSAKKSPTFLTNNYPATLLRVAQRELADIVEFRAQVDFLARCYRDCWGLAAEILVSWLFWSSLRTLLGISFWAVQEFHKLDSQATSARQRSGTCAN